MPVGGLLAGGLATADTRTAIGLLAGVHLVACLGMLLSPFRRLRDLPQPSTSEVEKFAQAARPKTTR